MDPTKHFLISKVIAGVRNVTLAKDVRLPITKPILKALLRSLKHVVSTRYEQALLHCAFSMAFYAFMRIGELTARSLKQPGNVLAFSDVHVTAADQAVVLTLHKFKHSNKQGAQNVIIKPVIADKLTCPVRSIRRYQRLRGTQGGAFLRWPDGKPYQHRRFDMQLRRCLSYAGYSAKVYKGHSFRIGAATEAAEQGLSDSQIRNLGRWTSDAYRKYIRCTSAGFNHG